MPIDTDAPGISDARRRLFPSPVLPLVHLGGAHLALGIALIALAARPDVASGPIVHPRFLAILHLLTLGWISGSILGAIYIVVPLAFGASLRASAIDRGACLSFWLGAAGMIGGFWTGRYAVVGGGSVGVLVSLAAIGWRLTRALLGPKRRAPFGATLHLELAFANVLAAGAVGLLIAFVRATGRLAWLPTSLAAAHAHVAVLGWATMMIFGVGYRLIPMFVPAALPEGSRLALSAVLLEAGTIGVAAALVFGWNPLLPACLVLAAFAAFFANVRSIVAQRRPRPADLPRHDWSTWQTHLAMAYLFVAAALGLRVAAGEARAGLILTYGMAGLLGFVAQMVLGIGGRLYPLFAWYRAVEGRDGALPQQSVHRLIEPRLANAVFVLWTVGLPILMWGAMAGHRAAVAGGALTLLAGTSANAAHIARLLRKAGTQQPGPSTI